MPSDNLDPALVSEIRELRQGRIREAGPQEILQVVRTIIEGMNESMPTADIAVRTDLEDLADYIRETKTEIMTLRPEEISDEHLPVATVELDAIVRATEDATNSIMEAAEMIEEVASGADAEAAEKLTGATTKIYEACSFQDITGQRIGKVVKALQEIEAKVDTLIEVFGEEDEASRNARRAEREAERERLRRQALEEGELMEGPQLPEEAISQDDIDALFASMN